VTEWFDLGGTLQVDDTLSSAELLARTAGVQGLHDAARGAAGVKKATEPVLSSAVDFVLEGLYAQRKISRSVEGHFQAGDQPKRPQRPVDSMTERELPLRGDKKKYYN
jgi:magnesium chelatase subunit I